MLAQKAELFEQISAQGWSLSQIEDWELEWWADEMWLLESTWSPVGFRSYLTFIVDPQIPHTKTRKKGESVWAVEVSKAKPGSGLSAEDSFEMSLNQGWQKELPTLLKHLSKWRDESKEA